MIQPDDIRRKALNQYPKLRKAWLAGETIFPLTIPGDKNVDRNTPIPLAAKQIQNLRAASKAALGYGYTVEWTKKNLRVQGRNDCPSRITFDEPRDLLKLIGKQREFADWTAAVTRLRQRYPQLESWIQKNYAPLVAVAPRIDSLLAVVDYFVAHPRPNLFPRELPLPVDTKFIENHTGILHDWLEQVLPPHAIRADEDKHFERRFGLRYDDPLIFLRFLDDAVRGQAPSLFHECAVPLHELAEHPLPARRVIIVENKTNLRTLPRIADAIALGGLGNAVLDLRYVTWLRDRELWYWGDLDVAGFQILSRLRALLPHVRSILMDGETLRAWRTTIGAHPRTKQRAADTPALLTPAEQSAFAICAGENLQIEQEKFPHPLVRETFNRLFTPQSMSQP